MTKQNQIHSGIEPGPHEWGLSGIAVELRRTTGSIGYIISFTMLEDVR